MKAICTFALILVFVGSTFASSLDSSESFEVLIRISKNRISNTQTSVGRMSINIRKLNSFEVNMTISPRIRNMGYPTDSLCFRVSSIFSWSSHENASWLNADRISNNMSFIPGKNDFNVVGQDEAIGLIDKIIKSGVKLSIYTFFRGSIEFGYHIQHAKRALQQDLQKGRIFYTILRSSFPTEVWFGKAAKFDTEHVRVQIFGEKNSMVHYSAYSYIARFLKIDLYNPQAWNALFELGGPEPFSELNIIRTFENLTQKRFHVHQVSINTLGNHLEAASDLIQKSIARSKLGISSGDTIDLKKVLSKSSTPLKNVNKNAVSRYVEN